MFRNSQKISGHICTISILICFTGSFSLIQNWLSQYRFFIKFIINKPHLPFCNFVMTFFINSQTLIYIFYLWIHMLHMICTNVYSTNYSSIQNIRNDLLRSKAFGPKDMVYTNIASHEHGHGHLWLIGRGRTILKWQLFVNFIFFFNRIKGDFI